jgi:hypothetical protein
VNPGSYVARELAIAAARFEREEREANRRQSRDSQPRRRDHLKAARR